MTRTGNLRRRLRIALIGLAGLAAIVFTALAAGALLRTGDAVVQDGDMIDIYVSTNGFHTDIVVPTIDAAMDWRPLLAASPITRRALDAPYLALGWGSQAAYTELGTLSDLSFGLLIRAAAFDESVVHLQPVASLREGGDLRRVSVSRAGYRRLARHVEQSLARDASGRPIVLDGLSHGAGDAFLRGSDRFWLLRSCNVWVAEALRAAGVGVGLWTPLARSLMWSLGAGAAPGPKH